MNQEREILNEIKAEGILINLKNFLQTLPGTLTANLTIAALTLGIGQKTNDILDEKTKSSFQKPKQEITSGREDNTRQKAELAFEEMQKIEELEKKLNGNNEHDHPIIREITRLLLPKKLRDGQEGSIRIQFTGFKKLGRARILKFQRVINIVFAEFMENKFEFDISEIEKS